MELQTVYAPAVGEDAGQYAKKQKKIAFKADIYDFIFAIAAFVLGYLFSRWVLFAGQGWGVSVFATAYLTSVTAYLKKKGALIWSREAIFWMAVTWAAGLSYALWENISIAPHRILFIFCSAVYYVIVASDRAIMGKTSNFLLIDALNTVIIVPFRNFINQYLSFAVIRKYERVKGKYLSVVIGVALALVLASVLIPLLVRADSGGFRMILDYISTILNKIRLSEFLFYFVVALPIAAYIYGLVSGAAHNRGADAIKPEAAKRLVDKMRIFQPVTVFIVLGAVCGLYLVFILSQIPYFFSAFTGKRPEGWLIYSEYARHGFFELCGIAAINLGIVTICSVSCKKARSKSRALKAFIAALAVITLTLIATAMSKMALYVSVYGLSMPRLLPCVLMVFMAVVFIALIALQKWDFSIVRFALITGSAILCVLCLSNPDAAVVRYNTDRHMSGTLPAYDVEILYRAGSAGVLPALDVFEWTDDMQLRREISTYFQIMGVRLANADAHTKSFETYRIRPEMLFRDMGD